MAERYPDLREHLLNIRENIRKGLLVYCKLDTYAMAKIWERLREVIGK